MQATIVRSLTEQAQRTENWGPMLRRMRERLMSNYQIHGLRGPSFRGEPEAYEYWTPKIYRSLQEGEGRFGWSWVETADLRQLRKRIEDFGWEHLKESEQECYQEFLLDFNEGDYVVYINVPQPRWCTLARVTGACPYYWKWAGEGSDFNHRFHVDPNSIAQFERKDAIVQRSLYHKLNPRRKYQQIYDVHEEFEGLLEALQKGKGGTPSTPETRIDSLREAIRPSLSEITEQIRRNYPREDLEELIARVFRNVPGVKTVREQGGRGEHGADLMVTYESGLPIPDLQEQNTCVVQVKAFKNKQWDTGAVEQIRVALDRWNADAGLIVSAASSTTPALDDALDQLREETNKPVGLLIGEDLAAFVLRFGAVSY